jgi:hypothetical protein
MQIVAALVNVRFFVVNGVALCLAACATHISTSFLPVASSQHAPQLVELGSGSGAQRSTKQQRSAHHTYVSLYM